MSKYPTEKEDLTLKVELSASLIERILQEYVEKQYPGLVLSSLTTKVQFKIESPRVDYRGETYGSPTLSSATVEISKPV